MSVKYWERRYKTRPELGSGKGSTGARAKWKADFVNKAAANVDAQSVLDIGCGDARQAALYDLPGYIGWDPSEEAIRRAQLLMPVLAFTSGWAGVSRDMHISMDVVQHLLTQEDYDSHLRSVFSAARSAVICAPAKVTTKARHMKHWDWLQYSPMGWIATTRHTWADDGSVCQLYVRG